MKRFFTSLSFVLLSAVSVLAQPSDTYYKRIDGKQQSNLKAELNVIISNHKTISYNGLWEAYAVTDVVGTTSRIFDYYSDNEHYVSDGSAQSTGLNREHVCPQSWWGGGTSISVGSDLFQVLPSDSEANGAKSNYPVGKVTGAITYSNNRIKVGKDANGKTVFEPCDEYKGDFARIYFYVATCYPNVNWQTPNGAECAFNQEAYPTIKSEYTNLLLQWNEDDPVSDWEKTRQERVFGYQGNRNPFVDYPDLANFIWGCLMEDVFDLSSAELYYITPYDYSGGSVIPQPGDDVEVGDVLLAEDFSSASNGNSTENQGSSSGWNGNDNFPTVNAAYQAGGAVKLGTGSKVGSLTSKALNFAGGQLVVTAQVNGWTSVEGKLIVSVEGTNLSHELTYTATMGTDWETVKAVFEDVPANPQITFATSAKRCFIDAITIYTAKEAEPETELDITLASNIATFCSTLDLDFSEVEGMKAYIASGYTHGNITLTRVTNVPAGTGLVLMGEKGTYTVPVGDGLAVLSNLLVGVTQDKALSTTSGSKTNFILANGADGIGFYKSNGGTLAAGKAYLPLPTALVAEAGVKSFGLQFEDGEELPTDIADLLLQRSETASQNNEHNALDWYTLDGRRLSHQPQQSGIYVRNGHKMVIR